MTCEGKANTDGLIVQEFFLKGTRFLYKSSLDKNHCSFKTYEFYNPAFVFHCFGERNIIQIPLTIRIKPKTCTGIFSLAFSLVCFYLLFETLLNCALINLLLPCTFGTF